MNRGSRVSKKVFLSKLTEKIKSKDDLQGRSLLISVVEVEESG